MKYIRNAWYPAGLSEMITTKPVREMVFGEAVALYRTASGQPAALQDRCPHRFVPLHMGMVVGENLECPYHGLQFGVQGACVFNPHGDRKIPAAAKVKHYPLVERHGIVWIWPGDPALADASKIIDLEDFLGNGKLPVIGDSFTVNATAGLVLDNLLDVSHAPFIHRSTFANLDDTETLRFSMKQEGDTVWAYNDIPNIRVTNLFKPFWKSPAERCDSIAHMRWDPPYNARLDVGVAECGDPPNSGLHIYVVHLLRPIDEHHTRYYWLLARNFGIDSEHVSEVMKGKINEGFTEEDEPAIAACAANMGTSDLMSLKPVLLPGDAAAMRARRILEQKTQTENAPTAAAS